MDRPSYVAGSIVAVAVILAGGWMIVKSTEHHDMYWLVFGLAVFAAGVHEFRRLDRLDADDDADDEPIA